MKNENEIARASYIVKQQLNDVCDVILCEYGDQLIVGRLIAVCYIMDGLHGRIGDELNKQWAGGAIDQYEYPIREGHVSNESLASDIEKINQKILTMAKEMHSIDVRREGCMLAASLILSDVVLILRQQ